MKKGILFLVVMMAMGALFGAGTASAANSVYINSNSTFISGYLGDGSNFSDPGGYIDATTSSYITSNGAIAEYIYVTGKNPAGLIFQCYLANTDPSFNALSNAMMPVGKTAFISVVRHTTNAGKCGSISVRN